MIEDSEQQQLRPISTQIDENVEQEIYHALMQENFVKRVESIGINLEKLVKSKKKDATMFHRLNYLLKDLHITDEVNICDSITYLEGDFGFKELFKCLNAENTLLVKGIMAERYNIKSKKRKSL